MTRPTLRVHICFWQTRPEPSIRSRPTPAEPGHRGRRGVCPLLVENGRRTVDWQIWSASRNRCTSPVFPDFAFRCRLRSEAVRDVDSLAGGMGKSRGSLTRSSFLSRRQIEDYSGPRRFATAAPSGPYARKPIAQMIASLHGEVHLSRDAVRRGFHEIWTR
jgi:hypothetical protein